MALIVCSLGKAAHDRPAFDCGEPALDLISAFGNWLEGGSICAERWVSLTRLWAGFAGFVREWVRLVRGLQVF